MEDNDEFLETDSPYYDKMYSTKIYKENLISLYNIDDNND
jgi:hypothetical protein